MISCEICGQGSHKACIFEKLQIPIEEQAVFDPTKTMEKLNPTGLPGIHYLCGACEESNIPDSNAGLLKRRAADGTESERDSDNSQPVAEVNQQESNSQEDAEIEAGGESTSEQGTGAQNGPDAQQAGGVANAPNVDERPRVNKDLCPFYRKGTCRYGSSGKGCPKDHPKPFKKLLQHGI